ncbi:MAG: hypothetical protein JNJ98_07270 [Gemmatimonadetes bacterium]|nr:hypothetical protein [Gemmatimonadota bacterium]
MKRILAVLVLAACATEERPMRDPATTALQVELLERGSRDQAIRDSAVRPGGGLDSALAAEMGRIDRDNAAWLKGEIARHGWPSRDKVGERASEAAFLIVQHATHDPAFQASMLDTLTQAWARKEIDGESYALLFDRVQTEAGRKQRYGTQASFVGGAIVIDPMEDSTKVDSLRQTVGLGTLTDYRRVLDSVYRATATKKQAP